MNAILVLNAGSSSIKFAAFPALSSADRAACGSTLRGQIEGIGDRPRFRATAAGGRVVVDEAADMRGSGSAHQRAMTLLLRFVERFEPTLAVVAVGHRVVHGGSDLAEPWLIDDALLVALDRLVPLAPLHQPHNLAGIRAAMAAFPGVPQVACFDTAFHRRQPWVADTFALPRRFYDQGVRRYGFHGLSYDYVTRHLRQAHPALARGRVVIAHLGNGASLCAVADGRPMGSTMGFTALDGMPMGTRTGQLDPGVLLYLIDEKGMGARELETLLYKQSGLLGLSGISGDWRQLESSSEPAARDATSYFTHRALREIGALAAVMGGLDGLVFTAGIGENASGLRHDIAQGLAFLGVAIDDERNRRHDEVISRAASRVAVLVVATDEEAVIAGYARAIVADRHSS